MKIAVISGKGGSGKSSVTAALISLATDVVAVDCDVDASNLPLLFDHSVRRTEMFASGCELTVDADRCIGCGVCVEACRYGALHPGADRTVVADSSACEACGLCVRLCGRQAIGLHEVARSRVCVSDFRHGVLVHGDLYPGDDNSGRMIARLRAVADAAAEERGCGLQILDGPPGIGCPVLSTVTGMDRVVIVAEPTLSGMADLKRAFRVASSFCERVSVVINKADVNGVNRRGIRDFCRGNGLEVVAELPFDKRMVMAQLHCRSIVEYAPDSVCAHVLAEAFAGICG